MTHEQNTDHEKALLCAMLREPSCIEAVASVAGTDDFCLVAHRLIFTQTLALFQAGENPDLVTVTYALRQTDELEAAGGALYLSSLLDMGAIGANAKSYALRVHHEADKRRARDAIKTAISSIGHNGNSPYAAIASLIEQLQAIIPEDHQRQFPNLAERVRDYISTLEGTFTNQHLIAELGIKEAADKTNIRKILNRLKGSVIQPHGNQAGCWRIIHGEVEPMDLADTNEEELNLWLPLDLHNYVRIMPGNQIVITGDPDSGKTAFLLRTICQNLDRWDCHYFNSEMGAYELRKRLDLFHGFPVKHPHFHAYERSDAFEDIVRPGKYVLNVIDYLEITDEFYLIAKRLADIYRALQGSVALIAIQKRNKTSDLPLGGQRALEKPRLAIALSAGNKTTPNRATILKCKNRRTEHSMNGKARSFKLIAGCEFRSDSPIWD